MGIPSDLYRTKTSRNARKRLEGAGITRGLASRSAGEP